MNTKHMLPAMLAAALLPLSAHAAEETVDATQVYLMDGELHYVGKLSAEANAKLFALYAAQEKKPTTLSIRSPGGDTNIGMALGLWVYYYKLDVKVMESCFSSCANYVFTAARNKIVSNFAVVGYHGGLSSTIFRISDESLVEVAKKFDGDLEKARNAIVEHVRASRDKDAEWEAKFFKIVGVQQRITTLGQADEYMKAAPAAAIGWYYDIEDFAKLGVSNITVLDPPWQPKLLVPGASVFKVTVE